MHGIIQLKWYRIPLAELEYYEILTEAECQQASIIYPNIKIVCHKRYYLNPGTITEVDRAVARAISDDAAEVLRLEKQIQELRNNAGGLREYIERMIFKNRRWPATPPVIKEMIKHVYQDLKKFSGEE